jgi:hypothetical protein
MTSPALPSVFVRVGDAPVQVLLPGEVIGRSASVALSIDDPGVSEVHAYVSLRGGKLIMLGLRGRLGHNGHVVPKVVLEKGSVIQLARDIYLTIVDLNLPPVVLAIEGDNLPRQVLPGTCSLVFDPNPTLAPGSVNGAALQLWTFGDDWHVRLPSGQIAQVSDDDEWSLPAGTYRPVWVSTDAAGADATVTASKINSPLTLRAQYDAVQIERDGESVIALSGRAARLVSELIAFDGPVGWELLAREVWTTGESVETLRPKLDVTLNRLRKKLQAVGIRRDLVKPDGCGMMVLTLGPGEIALSEG